MSIFKLSTGQQAASSSEAELGGNSEPIPEGTKLRAVITESKWDKIKDSTERYINNRWDVVDGEFKKRVVFQKVRVHIEDEKKADKHRTILAAIDHNCGGGLQKLTDEPTDMDLTKCLTNKPMVIRVGVWEMGDGKGNWVQAVSSGKAESKAKSVAPIETASTKPSAPSADFEDDIPF